MRPDSGIDVEAFYTRYGPMVLRRCRGMPRNESARQLFEYILRLEKESTRRIAVMYFLDGMILKEIAELARYFIESRANMIQR